MRSILANIFISQIHIEGSGLLTISKVKVTDDLKIAKIYISFLDNSRSVKELLGDIIAKKNIIKNLISNEIKLKYIPELRFFYDDTMEQSDKINQLMNTLKYND